MAEINSNIRIGLPKPVPINVAKLQAHIALQPKPPVDFCRGTVAQCLQGLSGLSIKIHLEGPQNA